MYGFEVWRGIVMGVGNRKKGNIVFGFVGGGGGKVNRWFFYGFLGNSGVILSSDLFIWWLVRDVINI